MNKLQIRNSQSLQGYEHMRHICVCVSTILFLVYECHLYLACLLSTGSVEREQTLILIVFFAKKIIRFNIYYNTCINTRICLQNTSTEIYAVFTKNQCHKPSVRKDTPTRGMLATAILITIEGRETAFNGF
jgi:hypothetical protein